MVNKTSATDCQMAVQWNDVISILCCRINFDFLNQILLVDQVATQLSSQDWVEPGPHLINI